MENMTRFFFVILFSPDVRGPRLWDPCPSRYVFHIPNVDLRTEKTVKFENQV